MKKKEWILLSSMSFILMASITGIIMILASPPSSNEDDEESFLKIEKLTESLEQKNENEPVEETTDLKTSEQDSLQIPMEKRKPADDERKTIENGLQPETKESLFPNTQSEKKIYEVFPTGTNKHDNLFTPIEPQAPVSPKMKESGN